MGAKGSNVMEDDGVAARLGHITMVGEKMEPEEEDNDEEE